MDKSSPQICERLFTLLLEMKQQIVLVAEMHGLTTPQVFTLYATYRRGELAMGEIAEMLHCDASNVTGIVDRLVSNDWAIRSEHPDDRRIKTVRLTVKGERFTKSLLPVLSAQMGCAVLTRKETMTLTTLLNKIGTSAAEPS